MIPGKKFVRPSLAAFVAFFSLALIATAGSLTPSASPAGTMHSLANVYDVIASSAYDSTLVAANQNGSLIGMMKYVESNMFSTNLGSNVSITSNSYTWDFGGADVLFGQFTFDSSQTASATSEPTWTQRQPSGVSENLNWVAMDTDADGSNLIAGAYAGRLYTSANSGVSWTERQPSGVSENLNWWTAASDDDGSFLVAGTQDEHLYTSNDSGVSWTERVVGGNSVRYWNDVDVDSTGQRIIAADDNGYVFLSIDSGANWTELYPAGIGNNPEWIAVAIDSDGSNLIAAALSGRIYTSANSGTSWDERTPSGTAENLSWYSVSSDNDGSNLAAVVYGGRLYTSANGGVSWTERQPGGNSNFNWFKIRLDADGSHLIAGIDGGRLYISTNLGVTWHERRPTGNAEDLKWQGLAVDADGSNYLVGVYGGRVYTGVTSVVANDLLTIKHGISSVLSISGEPETALEITGTASVSTILAGNITLTNSVTADSALIAHASISGNFDISGILTVDNRLISTVATGTAPFSVLSPTVVTSLNSDFWDGYHSSDAPFVNNTTDTTLTRSGTGPYTLGLNLANANTWAGAQTFGANTYFPGSSIWSSSGRVGIGTTSPTEELHVLGDVLVESGVGAASVTSVSYSAGVGFLDLPTSAATGDLNADGRTDFVVMSDMDTVDVFLNNGDGTFATQSYATSAPNNVPNVVLGNVDNANGLDIIYTDTIANRFYILLNNGSGAFGAATSYLVGSPAGNVATADLNGDSFADVVVAIDNSIRVFLNDGDGTFSTSTDYAAGSSGGTPRDVVLADLDGVNGIDVVTTNGAQNNISVLLNNGSGAFGAATNYSGNGYVENAAFGDVDGDGDVDVVTGEGSPTYGISVLLNNGSGVFGAATAYANGGGSSGGTSKSVVIIDMDGDGHSDVVQLGTGASAYQVFVFINDGGGLFGSPEHFTLLPGASRMVAANFGNTRPNIVVPIANYANTRVAFISYTPAPSSTTAFFAQASLSRFGVGNTTPDATLDVTGNILASASGNVDITLRSSSATANDGKFIIRSAGISDRFDILGGAIPTTFLSIASSGNVGIGTSTPEVKLEVVGTASVSRMYIGLWGAGTGNALCHTTNGNASASQEIVDCTSGPTADYMELYPMDSSVEEGEIVAPDSSVFALDVFGNKVSKLVRSQRAYQDSVIGITSIASLGTDFNMIGRNLKPEDNPKPLALAGRVRVKVSTQNGPIAVGDRIAASDIPGVGMKATRAGTVVGTALESLDTIASESQRIMVFVQPQYWAPEDTDDSVFEDMFAAVIKAFRDLLGIVFSPGGVIEAQKLCLGDSCITQSQLQELMQRGRVSAPTDTPTPTPTPTPSDTPTPTPSETPTETPTPTPTPTPIPTSEAVGTPTPEGVGAETPTQSPTP